MPSKAKTERKIKNRDDYIHLAIMKNGSYRSDTIPKRIADDTDKWYCNKCKAYVNMSFYNLQNAQQFSCCNPFKRKVLLDYKNIAILRGGLFLPNIIPENASTSVEGWCCEKDHERYIWSTCYNSIMTGKWCSICAGNKPKELSEYQTLAMNIGWSYLPNNIPQNINTSIHGWQCSAGHVITISYGNVSMGKRCTYCYGNAKKELPDYQTIGIEKQISYSLDYIPENTDTSIRGWVCKNGHTFESSYGCIRDDKFCCWECPKPPQSSYEIRVEKVLETLEYKYQTQYCLPNFVRYKYDFYIDTGTEKWALEIDGEQHFNYIEFIHETDEYFQRRRNDDIIKTRNIRDANMKLLRIDFKFIKQNKDEVLAEFIKTSLKSSEQFITTNKEMYKWIYDAVYSEIPKPKLNLKPKLKLIS